MKHFFISCLLLMFAVSVQAQFTAKDAWLSMPDECLPYLNKGMRADHVEFYNMNIESKVKNLLQGKCVMDTLTADFLSVRLNESATFQLKTLPCGVDTLICCVKTLSAPVAESEIHFYRSDWSAVDGYFGLPVSRDPAWLLQNFTARPDTLEQNEFNEQLKYFDPVMLAISFSPGGESLKLQIETPTLTKSEKLKVNAIVKQRNFKWNGESFNEY